MDIPSPHTEDLTDPLDNNTMSQPCPSPTRFAEEAPVSPTALTPDTPSSATFAPHVHPNHSARSSSGRDPRQGSQAQVSLRDALDAGPVAMPKNPRRLSEIEANLSRQDRRKSKAWSGPGSGIPEAYDEGEEGGGRRRSPPDAEELKLLVVGKLKSVSFVDMVVVL